MTQNSICNIPEQYSRHQTNVKETELTEWQLQEKVIKFDNFLKSVANNKLQVTNIIDQIYNKERQYTKVVDNKDNKLNVNSPIF